MSLLDCGRELFDTMSELKACRPGLGCLPEFYDQLTIGLGDCKIEFWKVCDFDRIIRVCPFDPAWDAFEWKQQTVLKGVRHPCQRNDVEMLDTGSPYRLLVRDRALSRSREGYRAMLFHLGEL